MTARYFDADIIGTKAPATADLGPLFATTLEVHKATEEGIQAAHEHANDAWRDTAYAALLTVARSHPLFTADEVWAELKGARPVTHEPSAIGGLFRIAAHKGLIVKSGRQVATTNPTRHRYLTEWKSLMLDRE